MSQHDALERWFASQIPDADEVRIDQLDKAELGHSAEMMLLTLAVRRGGAEEGLEVVLRARPPEPGLLEPYDLQRQFDILRGLEDTDVRSPKALWIEPSGSVLGRAFFVMERAPGEVFEMDVPAEIKEDGERVRAMCEDLIDQLAAIHLVDLEATGLDALGDGVDHVTRELARWGGEMRRVQRGPLPALERLLAELEARQPAASARCTLVHGDMKPGNFAFEGDAVSAVFDWELTDVGDPMTDIGYLELLWSMPVGINSLSNAPTYDELVARYEAATGIEVRDRAWHKAFQTYKIAMIMLLGSMLFDAGHSDDLRFAGMGGSIPFMTGLGLQALGIEDELEAGPVSPRQERLDAVKGVSPY